MSELSATRVLLEKWHAGDKEALRALIERNLPWIRGRVEKRMGPLLARMGSATDYVQDAMLEILRYGPKFVMSDEAQFRALVCKVIENVLRGRHDWFTAERRNAEQDRALASDSVIDLDPAGRSVTRPSEVAVRRETQELLRLAIGLLDADDREIIVWREWDGLSFADIASQLDITEDSARMRFNRALPQLAEKIDLLRKGDFASLLKE